MFSSLRPGTSTGNTSIGSTRMPAPAGNHNASKHGLHTVRDVGRRHGISSPRLPKKYRYINHRCDELRRDLEDAVIDQYGDAAFNRHGDLHVTYSNVIGAAIDHECGRQYLYAKKRECVDEGKPLSLQVEIQLEIAIGKCADARKDCIKELKLNTDPKIITAVLYPSLPDGFSEPPTDEPDESPSEEIQRPPVTSKEPELQTSTERVIDESEHAPSDPEPEAEQPAPLHPDARSDSAGDGSDS